ncbi:LysR family transcriptional regulator [Roseateles sp. DAIF2]|uniref:LysR family transcriptional regulator n=1 Tax=Roseateles sp. DAIF2 TaxID=2714952 RepID=UPI0018A2C4CE|nr:LysR family transcriptional regulator [Roseateles sp. DAIF2]QPF71666.1 LysR family transcriptional regulator [Roseateles sp. DAIF2]
MDNKRIPPLPALRAFEAAARHMSFARAANELHLSAAAISHQVKQLEHWLGQPLFQRHANGVALTDEGRDYALRVRDAFEGLVSTSRSMREHRARPVVSVRAQLSVATLWLTPRVIALNRLRPEIEIRVLAEPHRSTGRLNADLSLYYRRTDLPGHTQHLLLNASFQAHAAPALLEQQGRPRHRTRPADVLRHLPLLHLSAEDRGWSSPGFEEWFAQAGVPIELPLPGLRFNLVHLAAQACMQGAGVALLPTDLCADAVQRGQLLPLPGPSLPAPLPYFLMCADEPNEAVGWVRDALLKGASG